MNAEFNWWLLIVGLVVGAGLVWLVVADSRRREADVAELERAGEARWIALTMADAGRRVAEADVLDVLRLHAAYLAAAPPDDPIDAVETGPDADWLSVDRSSRGVRPTPDERAADDRRAWGPVPEPPPAPEASVNRR
ncbi:MAG: hypothetical protein ABIZ72_09215 [Candidatus Limnocylindrales bacterium]